MSNELEYYRNLADTMYTTRSCRFSAAAALAAKDRFSVGTVAFLSIYILGWSVVALSYPEIFNSTHARFYNAISVVCSASSLVITLMDFGFNRTLKAEKLHQNALCVSLLMGNLQRELASASPDERMLRKIAEDYERAMSDTQINHTFRDLLRWRYESAKSKNALVATGYALRRTIYNIWFYSSAMFIHIFLILVVIIPTLWYTIFIVWPGRPGS
jgi:hypothetical protein